VPCVSSSTEVHGMRIFLTRPSLLFTATIGANDTEKILAVIDGTVVVVGAVVVVVEGTVVVVGAVVVVVEGTVVVVVVVGAVVVVVEGTVVVVVVVVVGEDGTFKMLFAPVVTAPLIAKRRPSRFRSAPVVM
jgi:hypothetical protein